MSLHAVLVLHYYKGNGRVLLPILTGHQARDDLKEHHAIQLWNDVRSALLTISSGPCIILWAIGTEEKCDRRKTSFVA